MDVNFIKFLEDSGYSKDKENCLVYLEAIQNEYGHVSYRMLADLGSHLDLDPGFIQGIASFYHYIDLTDSPSSYRIALCKTLSCSLKTKKDLINHIESRLGLKFGERDNHFSLEFTNCMGLCDMGPAMIINNRLFTKMDKKKFDMILATLKTNNSWEKYGVEESICYKKGPLLEEKNVNLDRILNIERNELLDIILKRNIRGRGGAGFPIGKKWEAVMKDEKKDRYIVCNCDEGEPGTFKDRYLLHTELDTLIKGMIIAAYITGSKQGFIYLRGEYYYLAERIKKAIEELTSNSDFHLELRMGMGAYICGEETALIESLEGKRGEARNRPPYPADVGYLQGATAVNNAESFVNVAKLLENHIEGREFSDTRLYSISGTLEQEGIYEFSLKNNLKDILEAAKVPQGSKIIMGGASGKLISMDNLSHMDEDLPFGASIYIIDKDEDIWKVIENFIEFFRSESCGQCTPCREGLPILLKYIREYIAGERKDLGEIVTLAQRIRDISKCGLGKSSVSILLSYIEGGENEHK